MTFWVKRLDEVPLVPTDDPDDFDWYPLQHYFGLSAFGVNAYAGDSGTAFVHEHDESEGGQEEFYVVVRGAVRFTLDGEEHDARAISVVAIPDPEVTRTAVATEDGSILVAVGGPKDSGFATTWRPEHFEHVPRAD